MEQITRNLFFGKSILADWKTDTISKNVPEIIDDHAILHLYLSAPTVNGDTYYREFIDAKIRVYVSYVNETDTKYYFPTFSPLLSPLLYDKVTSYDQLPKIGVETELAGLYRDLPAWGYKTISADTVKQLVDFGVRISTKFAHIWTDNSDAGPHIQLTLGDVAGLVVTQLYPTASASISKALPTTFQFSATPSSSNTLKPVVLAASTLKWRYVGSSDVKSIALAEKTEYTFPAGTFESGEIEWQVSARANSGYVYDSAWTKVQVSEPVSSPVAISPKNTIVDGANSIAFMWEHVISNGTTQTGFDLQVSRDLQQWDDLLSEKSAINTVTFPANTFTSGDLYWRVRTYNLDDVAGLWSEPAHIIVIAAPAVPAVTVVAAEPKFTIRWHQTEQQGYEISINGIIAAKKYGATSEYTHNKYLDPGVYDVRVRIQNKYGYWSGWGECLLTVEQSDREPITLMLSNDGHVVHVSWSAADAYDSYFVYRNGVKICETADMDFIDQFAAGKTVYLVRGIYKDNGMCQVSEAQTIIVPVDSLMIAERANPKWIRIPVSTSSLRSTKATISCSVTYSYFAGSPLPDADVGEPQQVQYELDCAWSNKDLHDALMFEALLGKEVVIKTPTGKSFTAVLENIQPEENRFWTSYAAQLTQIDPEDEML